MSYCTLEEAWGSDFRKKTKKSKREKKSEKEKQRMETNLESQIIVPQMADTRETYRETIPDYKQMTSLDGFDPYSRQIGSPYQSSSDPVRRSNEIVEANNRVVERVLSNDSVASSVPTSPMVQISRDEYEKLKNRYVEGFTNMNSTDETLNQLLLFIFAGIFYLLMLDTMYQLGKKSY